MARCAFDKVCPAVDITTTRHEVSRLETVSLTASCLLPMPKCMYLELDIAQWVTLILHHLAKIVQIWLQKSRVKIFIRRFVLLLAAQGRC